MAPRLGILLSGSGSTYENIAQEITAGRLSADIAVVIASRTGVGGIDRAQRLGHPCHVAAEPEQVTALLLEHQVDWIIMCGWLKYYDPPANFEGRCLNIHPSLLPSFGGPGMYGMRVHRAVHASGVKLSGCTVHVVSGDYDSGPILGQQAVPVLPSDEPQDIADRVMTAERALYPRVIAAALTSGIEMADGRAWCPGL